MNFKEGILFTKFAKRVFEQNLTPGFLDLQKAGEAQTREAEIELALETRVRSPTMGNWVKVLN